MNARSRHAAGRILSIAALAAGTLVGCVGYSTWPPVSGTTFANPNSAANEEIMIASLAWIIERDHPDGLASPVAINLPSGVTALRYARMAQKIGPNVEPLSRANAAVPIYHIVEFKVRGSDAEVIVLRPATEITEGSPAEPVYQGYRLKLSGGFDPWHVTWFKPYSVGTISAPPLSYIDAAAGAEVETAAVEDPSGG